MLPYIYRGHFVSPPGQCTFKVASESMCTKRVAKMAGPVQAMLPYGANVTFVVSISNSSEVVFMSHDCISKCISSVILVHLDAC